MASCFTTVTANLREWSVWPESLEKLVPEYLPAVPLDPHANPPAPLIYGAVPTTGITYEHGPDKAPEFNKAVADAGPKARMLYGRAVNGQDHGGVTSWNYRPTRHGDWLVHLPGEPVPPQPDARPHRDDDFAVMGYKPRF